jgi:hypothetical protein
MASGQKMPQDISPWTLEDCVTVTMSGSGMEEMASWVTLPLLPAASCFDS